MQINSIGIIGGTHGLGARFVTYFQNLYPEKEILFSGRETEMTNQALVEYCDLIIFSIPIEVTKEVTESLVDVSRADQIWADFTSIKTFPVEAMLKSKAEVVGLHPLFGPLEEIEGQTLIYTPSRISEKSLGSVLKIFEAFNCMEFTSEEHDNLMGVVQCVSHLSDMVMGETLRRSGFDFETIWQVASPAYRLKLQVMGRMFGQNPKLYADIATYNPSAHHFTKLFSESMDHIQEFVRQKDSASLIEVLEANQSYLGNDFCRQSYQDSQKILSEYTAKPLESKESSLENLKSVEAVIFGERYSHTDSASDQILEASTSRGYVGHVFQVFEALEQEIVKCGILPYENSTQGSVLSTLDGLLDHPKIQIVTSEVFNIKQNLLGLPGSKIEDLKVVCSHPQALAQSHKFLIKNIPKVKFSNEASTSLAAQKILREGYRHQACVGSEALAQALGLEILASGIQESGNATRFVKVQKSEAPQDTIHTSFVFWFSENKSGALARFLTFLFEQDIELIKLDSRRAPEAFGFHRFFVDAKISIRDFEALAPEFKPLIGGYKILGGF